MSQPLQGACHCGRVTFQVQATPTYALECSCSICRRKGALWLGASDAQVRILSGEEELTLYQFNTLTAKHYFCRRCGIHPLTRPRLDPRMWVVNLRCIDGIDLSALPVQRFDGEHWEDAARALRAKMRGDRGSDVG